MKIAGRTNCSECGSVGLQHGRGAEGGSRVAGDAFMAELIGIGVDVSTLDFWHCGRCGESGALGPIVVR